MKTIYIKDGCCGIKIYCPDEYNCMLINYRKNKESTLRFTKVITPTIKTPDFNIIKYNLKPGNQSTIFIDICFNSLGTYTDSINDSEYLYIMKNHKTNIKSFHCYSTNNPGINVSCDYKDDEYLTDLLKPINAVLNNHGVKISGWFIKSDIVASKIVWPGEERINQIINNAEAKNLLNSIYGIPNRSSDGDLISKMEWNFPKKSLYDSVFSEIKDIIINDPATIILWKDGTKTVVKCQPGDVFDSEKGIAMAILKKMYGNGGFYKDIFEPAIMKYELKKSLEKSKNNVAKKKEKKPPVK